MGRWRLSRLRSVVVLSCSLLLRCGGESADPGPAPHLVPDPDRPPNDTELALAEAACRYLARCEPDSLNAFARGAEAACRAYFACAAARGDLEPLRADVDIRACLESLDSRPCPDLEIYPYQRFRTDWGASFPWSIECYDYGVADAYAAAPPTGSACLVVDELPDCQEGDYCALESAPSFGSAFCGTCTRELSLGTRCTNRDRCAGSGRCINGICERVREPGEPCDLLEQCRFRTCTGGICARSDGAPEPYEDVINRGCEAIPGFEDCGSQPGLSCIDGKCQPLPEEGEPCTWRCRLGHECMAGRCVAIGCAVDPGERCGSSCRGGECLDGLCTPYPSRVGAACRSFCAPGLGCDQGRCITAPDAGNGAPCDYDYDCDSRFCDRDLREFCDGGSCSVPPCDRCGTCTAPPVASDCR